MLIAKIFSFCCCAAVVFILSLIFSSCKTSERDPQRVGQATNVTNKAQPAMLGIAGLEDLALPTNVAQIGETNLSARVNDATSVVYFRPIVKASAITDDECIAKILRNAKVDAAPGWVSADLDTTTVDSCLTEPYTELGKKTGVDVVVTSPRLLFRIRGTCVGQDLSGNLGNLRIVEERDSFADSFCKDGSKRASLMQLVVSLNISISQSGKELQKYTVRAIGGISSAGGGPCYAEKSDGNLWNLGTCTSYSITKLLSSDANSKDALQSEYLKGSHDGAKAVVGARYLKGGVQKLEINDWTGTLNYTDENTPPTWSLSRRSDNKRVDGVFVPFSSSTTKLQTLGGDLRPFEAMDLLYRWSFTR